MTQSFFHPSLWLLLRLLSRAGLRSVWRQFWTPTGAVVTILLVGMILVGLGPSLWMGLFGDQDVQLKHMGVHLPQVVPAGMLALTLLLLATNAGTQAVELRPAELPFVLAGPFTDRQILTYRLITLAATWMPLSVFFGLIALPYAPSAVGVFTGAVLIELYAVSLSAAMAVLGAVLPHSVFRIARTLPVVLAIWAVVRTGSAVMASPHALVPLQWLEMFGSDAVGRRLVWPFLGFGQLMAIAGVGQGFVSAASMPVLMCISLIVVCYVSNVHFTELAAIGVDRRQTRLAAVRAGRTTSWKFLGERPWLEVPDVPWFGGVGPVVWTQLVWIVRRFGRFILPALIVLVVFAVAYQINMQRHANRRLQVAEYASLFAGVGATYVGFIVILPSQLGFTMPARQLVWFRLLPTAPWRIAMGMSLGGCVLLWGLRLVIALIAVTISGEPWHRSLAVYLAGAVLDAGMFCALNMVAACTNMRLIGSGTPDLLQGGRAMFVMTLVGVALLPMLLVGTLFGGLLVLSTGGGWTAGALGAALSMLPFPLMFVGIAAWGFARSEGLET